MRVRMAQIVRLMTFLIIIRSVPAQNTARDLYLKRCSWCHGEQGRGDGPSATGMLPAPRDFVRADYKIRSTPYGQLPTDDDLFRLISRGLPGTPMPGWEQVLTEENRRQLVSYIKSFSPRFNTEKRETLTVPSGAGSVQQGEKIFRSARCYVCHGDSGRADGGLTAALNFEWGFPYLARDFTRGWTFKGGHEPRDIYLRITGGLEGTPMGPYQNFLSNQERWDLAHYVTSLDREPNETSDNFVAAAEYIDEEIPDAPDASEWQSARSILVPLAGQVVRDPPLRWWAPTAGSANVRALWNARQIGFLLEWNDPTGPDSALSDSAFLQFATQDGSKPYFLFGGSDAPVKIWQWHSGNGVEEWTANGIGKIESHPAGFQTHSSWKEGRWRVIFRRSLAGEPQFETGKFIAVLFSVADGANAERNSVRAISTWLYTTLKRPVTLRPWLSALAWLLGVVILELWILSRVKS